VKGYDAPVLGASLYCSRYAADDPRPLAHPGGQNASSEIAVRQKVQPKWADQKLKIAGTKTGLLKSMFEYPLLCQQRLSRVRGPSSSPNNPCFINAGDS
jgi:hypothetical protein